MGPWSAITREIKFLHALLRTLGRVRIVDSRPYWLICDAFEAAADRWADNDALKSEDGALTYRKLDDLANGAARWAASQGLQRGDCVAIVLPNRLEYVALWLGFSKLGVVGALVNNNLTGDALAHCLEISGARHIISDATCAAALEAIGAERRARIWMLEPTLYGAHLRMERDAPRPARQVRAGMNNRNTALLIFTSGTTGMPKAAKITHARALLYMLGFAGSTGAREGDRIYCVLPLYHATGGLAALGAAVLNGGCFVIRRKFSASHFWDDVIAEGCTMFVYIGELCRYLLNQPPHPNERGHKLRLAFGNGLRPEVWTPFQTRFAMPNILEFYGSTEGNVSLFNFDGQPGAVGRVPFYVRNQFNVRLVKLDLETEAPIRGPDGLAQECAPGEIGETIGKIGAGVRTNYTGYVDKRGVREEGYARCVRQGRCLVPHRRFDAPGQGRLFLFRRSDGRHVPLERRKRLDHGSRRRALLVSGRGRSERLWRGRAGSDGRAGMAAIITRPDFDLESCTPAWRRSCPPMRGPCSCACSRRSRRPARSSIARSISCATASIPRKLPIRFISTIHSATRWSNSRPGFTPTPFPARCAFEPLGALARHALESAKGASMKTAIILAAMALAVSACSQTPATDEPAPIAAPRVAAPDVVAAGRYLVRIGGCNECHTEGYAESGGAIPESEWLLGSRIGYMGPWGTSYAANLRLSVKDVPEEAWIASIRARDGLPPMPWASLHAMDDTDLSAIYQYVKSLPTRGNDAPLPVAPGQTPRGQYYLMTPISGKPPK